MREFCLATIQLPTLKSLTGDAITYPIRPDLMPTFVAQATTIAPAQVAEVTIPQFAQINQVLQNQLEPAFLGGKDTGAALASLSDGIDQALKR